MSNQRQITPIDTLMEELDGGALGQRLALALADVARGVVNVDDKKKKGKVTLTFDIHRVGGDNGQVQIDHTLSFREPTHRGRKVEEITTSSVMFVGPRGTLTLLPNTNRDMFEANEEPPQVRQ